MEGVVNAVAAGIGIAPVLAVLLDHPAYREILTPVLPDYPLKQATLYAVHASRKFVPPKLRTFVDFLSPASEPRPRLLQALQPLPTGPAGTRPSNRRPAVAAA
jgi:DNA-binding transcriptional LysR family regulator